MFIRKIINKFRRKSKTIQNQEDQRLSTTKTSLANEPESDTAPPTEKKRKRRSRKTSRKKNNFDNGSPAWDISQFDVPPQKGKTRFHDLNLPDEILHAIADCDYQYCTPIQAEILQSTISGSDASGKAQTGTGKTAAFLITILTHLSRVKPPKGRKNRSPRALIIAPTRELVLQIVKDANTLNKYCHFSVVAVLGGVDYAKQQKELTSNKVDILVATPGRLLDFKRKQVVQLGSVEIMVIDEADRMLDMGFIPDVRNIIYSIPKKRQTLLFSATMTQMVTQLAAQWTKEPVEVDIEPEQVVTDTVEQVIYLITSNQKIPLLYNLITKQKLKRVIIFCNRKDETRRLADNLKKYQINCSVLSGEIPQAKRLNRLERFREGKIQVLIATDVAGRGIHIEGISHVINYTLPYEPEKYVHRVGRTGRSGSSGISISFADEKDSFYIPEMEEFIGEKLHCIQPDDSLLEPPPKPKREYHSKRPPSHQKGGRKSTKKPYPRKRSPAKRQTAG